MYRIFFCLHHLLCINIVSLISRLFVKTAEQTILLGKRVHVMYTHFNTVNIGYKKVYLFFLIFELAEAVLTCTHNQTINVLSKNNKNIKTFQMIFFFNFYIFKILYIVCFRYCGSQRVKHDFSILTHISLESLLWDIGNQNSPRCDAFCGVPSGAILFAERNFIEKLDKK